MPRIPCSSQADRGRPRGASGNSSRCSRAPQSLWASPAFSSRPIKIPTTRHPTVPTWCRSSKWTPCCAACSSSTGSRRTQNKDLKSRARSVIPTVLKIVGLVVFAQTLFTRAIEPVIPMIADDLAVDVKTAALLSSGFTLPYALVQPALGVTGDFFGKTRLMNVCLLVVALSALVCAVAMSFSLLLAMRVAAGLVAGGIFPVAMALTGDLVPVKHRQVAISRLLAVALTSNVVGSSIAGVIGDMFGWRGVFAILGSFGLIVTIVAFFAFRGVATPPLAPFNRAAMMANFRSIFANPRAKVCFTSVFFEAVFIAIGETRASIAGLLIATFAVGGVFYLLSVPVLISRVREQHLMVAGGALAAAALVLIALFFPWMWQIAIYGLFGFGFYLLHSCIQVHVTELSQTARGAAASLHSSFFYLGQAVGPVVYGYGFAHGGPEPSIFVGAAVVMTVGVACSRLLRHRTVY